MRADFRNAGLEPRVTALLEFVETVTLAPWEIGGRHWQTLRGHGWSDSEVAHAALGSAHFNYLNRVADGLGIPFEYTTDLKTIEVPRTERAATPTSVGACDSRTRGDARPFVTIDAARAEAAAKDLRHGEPRDYAVVLGMNPPAALLIREWRAYHLAGTERLPAALRAKIALFSAATEHATPCVRWQESAARAACVPPAEIAMLAEGEIPEHADAMTRFLLEHARRLLQSPWTATRDHVATMRSFCLDERDVVKFTTLVAYLSFEHRAALSLGA